MKKDIKTEDLIIDRVTHISFGGEKPIQIKEVTLTGEEGEVGYKYLELYTLMVNANDENDHNIYPAKIRINSPENIRIEKLTGYQRIVESQ